MRYVKGRVRANGFIADIGIYDEPGLTPELTVDGHEAVDTGLVWSTGEPIMRTPNPLGFGRDKEW